MDILYVIAYTIMAMMVLSVIAAYVSTKLETARKRNSIRYKKRMFRKPDIIDVSFREVA